MTITAARVDVTTSATVIAQNPASGLLEDTFSVSVIVRNLTGTADIYLGHSALTSSTGFPWFSDDGPLGDLVLEPGEILYGRVAAGQPTQTVAVLGGGR